MSAEDPGARIKRMIMRSWRRGTKEMDLILGPFADRQLEAMTEHDLVRYDQMLNENDQDLYRWITGQEEMPERLSGILGLVARHAGIR